MNALDQATNDLKKAEQQIYIANLLKREFPFEVQSLFISENSFWITLAETTLEDAIKKIKSLDPLPMGQFRNGSTLTINCSLRLHTSKFKGYEFTPYKLPFALKVQPPFGYGKDGYELYAFIEINSIIFKVKIPVNLPEQRLTAFTHNGSTSRSKIVKTSVVQRYEPYFNSSFVWGGGGVSECELFSI